jgi:hypothetical protein
MQIRHNAHMQSINPTKKHDSSTCMSVACFLLGVVDVLVLGLCVTATVPSGFLQAKQHSVLIYRCRHGLQSVLMC